MPTRKAQDTSYVNIQPPKQDALTLWLRSNSPYVSNAMSAKAKRTLLRPDAFRTRPRLRGVEEPKHDPRQEFLDSVLPLGADAAAAIGIPSTAFKAALMTAALDLPGATKAQIGRLVYVVGEDVPLFGRPLLFMTVVRMANIDRTPDIRTRAILPAWACRLEIRYSATHFTSRSIANLVAAAGARCGVGDFRQEKGKGNYGLFELVDIGDRDFLAFEAAWGRDVQLAALDAAEPYNVESRELLAWHDAELERSGLEVGAPRNGSRGDPVEALP